jgi:MFS family permease
MVGARVLLVLTCVLLIATTVAAYAGRALFDSDQFTDRATAALQDPSVRELVADRVTDELVLPTQPDLLAARPVIVSAVSGVVGGNAFAGLFRRAVRDVHRAVFSRDEDTATLTLVDAGLVVATALRQLEPELASQLQSQQRVELLERDVGSATGDLARLARDVRVLTLVLAALTLAAAIGAVFVSPDRRWAAARLGLAIAIAGVVVVAGDVIARALVLDRVADPDERAAAAAVWDAFLGDLRTAGWLIAGSGAVVAAAANSAIRPIDIEEPLRAAWRAVSTEPEATMPKVARAALLIATGVVVIAEPLAALRIVATLIGVYLLYKGLEALLRLINRPQEEADEAPAKPRRRPARRLVVPVASAFLIGAALAVFLTSGGVDEPAPDLSACNGHERLCDVPLDEVALPATHNAMSVPLPGWFAALQERPIPAQLEDGIRGLLLDTHYADLLPNGRTRTYFSSRETLTRALEEDGTSARGVKAAQRLRERLGFRGEGVRGMYLCHTFCELGSTPLADVLDEIHEFLVTHPADILVVINQDYVTPADFVGAVADAGLEPYMLEPPSGSQWPTLRELIDQGRRLVVLAENEAGAAPWYQLVYQRLTKETPFNFGSTSELIAPDALEDSCRPNRGPDTAPLFLVNHWINTDPLPLPSNAVTVNAYDPLLRRARACEESRGQRLNLLAVDFYSRGDLFEVVDTLNGTS